MPFAKYNINLKYFIILFILSGFSSVRIFADNTYPVSISFTGLYEGGKLLHKVKDSKITESFLLKQNRIEGEDVVYYWKGETRINAEGFSAGNIKISDAVIKENKLLIAGVLSNSLVTAELNTLTGTFNVISLQDLPEDYLNTNIRIINCYNDGSLLILAGDRLYLALLKEKNSSSFSLIQDHVIDAVCTDINSTDAGNIVILEDRRESLLVKFLNNKLDLVGEARVQPGEKTILKQTGNYVFVVNSGDYQSQSYVQVLDIYKKKILYSAWVDAKGDLIAFSNFNIFSYIKSSPEGARAVFGRIDNIENKHDMIEIELPDFLIQPFLYQCVNDKFTLLFKNGIVCTDLFGSILSADKYPFGEVFENEPLIASKDNYLILSSEKYSLLFQLQKNSFWQFYRFLEHFGELLIPFLFSIVIIIIIRKYFKQRRLLSALIDLPASGFVIVVDKSGRLRRINSEGRKILNMPLNVPLGRQFRFYCLGQQMSGLAQLAEQSIITKINNTQKISLADTGKEYFCTVNVLKKISGNFSGIVIAGVDITEELERKRLSNWAQLAHDMQTNLSTIKLNAEHLEPEESENNRARRKKILHQVNLLMHRVRDIVTVGRSDALNYSICDAADICTDARNEFDEALFPYVQFKLETESFQLNCDRQKLIRAIRNAVENGIRALKSKQGEIIITCKKDSRNACFTVKDTGMGMDQKTKDKILTPYFTTSQKEGGMGIGTMIMQKVAEQHNGTIVINSEPGNGTEIVFYIPLVINDKFQQKEKK